MENPNDKTITGGAQVLPDAAGSVPFDPPIPIGRAYALRFQFYSNHTKTTEGRGYILDCKSKAEAIREGKGIAERKGYRLRETFKIDDAEEYDDLIRGGFRDLLHSPNNEHRRCLSNQSENSNKD